MLHLLGGPVAIEYHARCPGQEEAFRLFLTTGWNARYGLTAEELERAMRGSWRIVSAYDGAALVGYGRVLSDGILHALIVDVIVAPDRQREGIGGEIMRRLLAECADVRDVQLFCARGKAAFYERLGFAARPEPAPGMDWVRRRPSTRP